MSATTLITAPGATIAEALPELLHVAFAYGVAETLSCGVTVWRYRDGHLCDAEADTEVAQGVIETQVPIDVDPWGARFEDDVRDMIEAMHQLTSGDLVATTEGVRWL